MGYEIVKKEFAYCDINTHKLKRKAAVTKNELFRTLIQQAIDNQVFFDYIVADNGFGSTGILFAAIIAYCKLELLKVKTALNHFAIKHKLILKAKQIMLKERRALKAAA